MKNKKFNLESLFPLDWESPRKQAIRNMNLRRDEGTGDHGGGSGEPDEGGTGEFKIEDLIPEDQQDAFKKWQQGLIDKGVDIGVGRGKKAAEKLSTKAVDDFLKDQGLSKEEIESLKGLKGLSGKQDALKKIWDVYGTEDPDEIIRLIEEAEDAEKTDLELAQKEIEKLKTALGEKDKQFAALKKSHKTDLGDKSKREEHLLSHIQKLLITGAVEREATKLGAYDPADVYRAVKESLKLEEADGEFKTYVFDENGEKRFNSEGNPFGVGELVSEFLEARPHLRKSDFTGGAGGAGKKPPTGGAPTFTKEQMQDPDFFIKNKPAIMQAIKDGKFKV